MGYEDAQARLVFFICLYHKTLSFQECKLIQCNKDLFGTTVQTPMLNTEHVRFKRRDLVLCTECCYKDMCNTDGCGSSLFGMSPLLKAVLDHARLISIYLSIYLCRTSIARTPMACLPGPFEPVFECLGNSSDSSRKQIFRDIFLFYHEIVCCVYSLA